MSSALLQVIPHVGSQEKVVIFTSAVLLPVTPNEGKRAAMAELIAFSDAFEAVLRGNALRLNEVMFGRLAEAGVFSREELVSARDVGQMVVIDNVKSLPGLLPEDLFGKIPPIQVKVLAASQQEQQVDSAPKEEPAS